MVNVGVGEWGSAFGDGIVFLVAMQVQKGDHKNVRRLCDYHILLLKDPHTDFVLIVRVQLYC